MNKLEEIKKELNEIIKYTRCAKLGESLERREGIVFLSQIDKDIQKIRMLRECVLEAFQIDTARELMKLDENPRIKINQRRLMEGDFLNLKIVRNSQEISCFFKYNELLSSSSNDSKTEEIANHILPYVNGLFRVLGNYETENILTNEFSEPIVVFINQIINKLSLSGENGLILSDDELNQMDLTLDEKIKLIAYFYDHLDQLLKRIYVLDDCILDRYKTDATKRKVLKVYRGKR